MRNLELTIVYFRRIWKKNHWFFCFNFWRFVTRKSGFLSCWVVVKIFDANTNLIFFLFSASTDAKNTNKSIHVLDWKKNSHRLSERLASLDIMEDQLRALLKLLCKIVLWRSQGVSEDVLKNQGLPRAAIVVSQKKKTLEFSLHKKDYIFFSYRGVKLLNISVLTSR